MKKLLIVLSAAFLLQGCRKDQATASIPQPSANSNSAGTSALPSQRSVEDVLDSLETMNGAFNFKDLEDLLDVACYLTNLKQEDHSAWLDFYASKGVNPLEFVYDRIGRQEDSLALADTGASVLTHCSEFTTRNNLFSFPFPDSLPDIYIKKMEWPGLAFVLNEDQKFYIGEELFTLQNGVVFHGTAQFKLFQEYTSNPSEPTTGPYTPCQNFSLPFNIFQVLGTANAGTNPIWTCENLPQLQYALIDNNPCAFKYKIIMTSTANLFRRFARGRQNVNGPMIHSGTFGTNLGTLNTAPWVLPTNIINKGAGYYWYTYGTSSTIIIFNETLIANYTGVTGIPSPFQGCVKVASWVPVIGFPGGCCGGTCFSSPASLSN